MRIPSVANVWRVREKLNAELKRIATEVLPFVIVSPLLKDILDQIETEKELKSYQLLKKKISTRAFKKLLLSTMEDLDSKDAVGDSEKLAFAIQDYFHKPSVANICFALTDEQASSLSSILTKLPECFTEEQLWALAENYRPFKTDISNATHMLYIFSYLWEMNENFELLHFNPELKKYE